LRGLGFSNHIPTQKLDGYPPYFVVMILSTVAHFIGCRMHENQIVPRVPRLCYYISIFRDTVPEPLHYFVPDLVQSTAVIPLPATRG
jgi:hypothetical protein